MRKNIGLYVLAFGIMQNTILISSAILTAKEIFDPQTWPQKKQEFSRKLKLGQITPSDLNFTNGMIENVDLSDMDFQEINFKQTIFKDIDLSRTNLTGAHIQKAILFDEFIVPNYQTHEDLVKMYAQTQDQILKDNLNKLFEIYPLNLSFADLRNLDLRQINFKKAKLIDADLQEAILSDEFIVPNYDVHEDLIRIYAQTQDQILKDNLNKLFEFYSLNLCSVDLRDLDLEGINFKNARLRKTNLSGTTLFKEFKIPNYETDLELVKIYAQTQDQILKNNLNKFFEFYSLNLQYEKLTHLDLKNINFKRAELEEANLSGTTFLENFQVPIYNTSKDLVKIYAQTQDQTLKDNLNKFFEIYPLNLHYENLAGFNLQKIKFKKTQLQGANLSSAILFDGFKVPNYQTHKDLIKLYSTTQDQTLKNNLNKLFKIYSVDLNKADLRDLDLQDLNLKTINLRGANLSRAILFDGFSVPQYNTHKDLVTYTLIKDQTFRNNLNKLLKIYPLNLGSADLINLDLQGINLDNSYLYQANLSGTLLFDGFKVPNYQTKEELIQIWKMSKDPKEIINLKKLFGMIGIHNPIFQ